METAATIAGGAERVKAELWRRGWSQAELARRIGADRGVVTKLLKAELISPFFQRRIARLLGLGEEELWGDLYWYPRYEAARRTA